MSILRDASESVARRAKEYEAGSEKMLAQLARARVAEPTAPAPHRNGCYDRPPLVERVKLGKELVMEQGEVIEIERSYPRRSTSDCVYTTSNLGRVDAGCIGCKHRDP